MSTAPMVDPRCFAAPGDNRYVGLAASWLAGDVAAQRTSLPAPLVRRYRDALERNSDGEIVESLRQASSASVYRCLWRALDAAILEAGASASVILRVFALPVVLVVGGRAPAVLPGLVPDPGRLREVFQRSGVLGPVRNFGLGNALCPLEALESLSPSRLFQLGRSFSSGVLDLPPADLSVTEGDEQVHLRFLLGAAVTPRDAPSFLETASAVATWGLPLTRELADQLSADGVSVLPIPRPPATILRAPEVGRRAREELALQAFVSRVVRRLRSRAGEPVATIAALDNGAVGIRVASPFIADRADTHEWPLHPIDDFQDVAGSIRELLRECRVERVQVLPSVRSAQEFALNPAA